MTLSAPDVSCQAALGRSAFYKVLAKSFLYPTEEVFDYICSPMYKETLQQCLGLSNQNAEISRTVRVLDELLTSWDTKEERVRLESEYNRLFAHLGSTQCPPYETEYGYENVFQKAEAMADIAGFYNAFGLEVKEENADRVDSVSMELEFMSYLALKEAYAIESGESEHKEICIDAEQKFLQDHLGCWVPVFSKILKGSTSNSFYLGVGILLDQFVALDVQAMGITPREVTEPRKTGAFVHEPFTCDGCPPDTSEGKPASQ